jgi:hypothetical protein
MSDFGEPWQIIRMNGRLHVFFASARPGDRVGVVSGPIEQMDSVWLNRAETCANALAGIEDPAAFVERAKAMQGMLRECEQFLVNAGGNRLAGPAALIARIQANREWTPDE